MICNPRSFNPTSTLQTLAREIFIDIHEQTASTNFDWAKYSKELLFWQDNSTSKALEDDIWQSTYQKGGLSLMLTRAFINIPFPDEERLTLMQLGGMIQFLDDLFDIWEDSNTNDVTLATSTRNPQLLEDFYNEQLERLFSSCNTICKNRRNLHKFNAIALLLFVRGHVMLFQLQELVKQNRSFNIQSCSREQLICDMATLRNNLKAMTMFIKHSRMIYA